MNTHLLSLIVAAPTVAALVIMFLPNAARTAMRIVALIGATVSISGSILALTTYDTVDGGLQRIEDYPIVPALGVHLRFAQDGWGGPLLLLTGVIIFAGVLASWTLDKRDKEYFLLLLVLVSGVFGVFVSQDLLMLFLFYEIAVLPMYLLSCELFAERKCPLVRRHHFGAFLRELLAQAAEYRGPRDAEPFGDESEHHYVLRQIGARTLFGEVTDGHSEDLFGCNANERDRVRRDAGLRFVDHHGVTGDWQLCTELQEVLPVQRDCNIERSAGVQYAVRRETHATRRLTTADLYRERSSKRWVVCPSQCSVAAIR